MEKVYNRVGFYKRSKFKTMPKFIGKNDRLFLSVRHSNRFAFAFSKIHGRFNSRSFDAIHRFNSDAFEWNELKRFSFFIKLKFSLSFRKIFTSTFDTVDKTNAKFVRLFSSTLKAIESIFSSEICYEIWLQAVPNRQGSIPENANLYLILVNEKGDESETIRLKRESKTNKIYQKYEGNDLGEVRSIFDNFLFFDFSNRFFESFWDKNRTKIESFGTFSTSSFVTKIKNSCEKKNLNVFFFSIEWISSRLF